MRKISDYTDADALDLLADLMEPAVTILADEAVRDAFENKSQIAAVKAAIKGHKDSVMEILARLDGVPVEEYHCNILTLPARLLEILNDKELLAFFTEQAQTTTFSAYFGSATENTEDSEA